MSRIDREAKKKWIDSILVSVEEAIEELEDGAEIVSGRHEDTNIHHIHDHLGWAEHLLANELKKLDGEDYDPSQRRISS